MYNGVKVLDVHGHVSSPDATSNYLMLMMAANTAFQNPLAPGGRATPARPPLTTTMKAGARATSQVRRFHDQ